MAGQQAVRPEGGASERGPIETSHEFHQAAPKGAAADAAGPGVTAATSDLDDDVNFDSDEGEEVDEVRRLAAGRAPTAKQRQEHEEENHAVYRDWCPVCIRARGLGNQHRKNKEKRKEEESEGPRIYSDFFFMSTDDSSTPNLALKFSRSKRLAATALPAKGVTEYGTKFFARFIEQTGIRRFINHSDNERAIVALKTAAALAVQRVEAVPRECPVGDHQANGDIEVGVRELKRQMRAIRLSLEGKLGMKLNDNDPILMWIPTFAGDAISRHRKGRDGKTPWERETGRKWAKHALEFGERVYLRDARDDGPTNLKRDWISKMIEARYVGHHARTGSVMGLTEDGLKIGKAVKRLPLEQRWNVTGWNSLKGLPWDLNPQIREVEHETPWEETQDSQMKQDEYPEPKPERNEEKSFYVKRADVERYGPTQGCRGCVALSKGSSKQAHSEECRKRIMEQVAQNESERMKDFHERKIREALFRHEGVAGSTAPKAGNEEDEKRSSSSGRDAGNPAPKPTAAAAAPEARERRSEDVAGNTAPREGNQNKEGESNKLIGKRTAGSSASNEEEEEEVERKEKVRKTVHFEGEAQRSPAGGEASTAGEAFKRGIVLPAEVPHSGKTDIEDANSEPGEIRRVRPRLSNMEDMNETKKELIHLASISVERKYRNENVDLSESESMAISSLLVSMGAAKISELLEEGQAHEETSRMGARAGYILDLSDAKPKYLTQRNRDLSKKWNFEEEEEMKHLEEILRKEEPIVLIGSSFQETSSSNSSRDAGSSAPTATVNNQNRLFDWYQHQHQKKRYFLHEQGLQTNRVNGNPNLIKLQSQLGVSVIIGPLCKHELSNGKVAYYRVEWTTNLPIWKKILEEYKDEHKGKMSEIQFTFEAKQNQPKVRYPPSLTVSLLKGLKEQLQRSGELSEMSLHCGGPIPSEQLFGEFEATSPEEFDRVYDEITGDELPSRLVAKARQEEIDWVRSIKLYEKVSRSHALSRGFKVVPTRWVDVNKGDWQKVNIRSRLVGKELKSKTKEALLAHELFSAMPPWEMVKALLSLLVTDGLHEQELELGVFDISRAHFMAKATRELYVEVPAEDKTAEEGDVVGRLLRGMYGFRDASCNWMKGWQQTLEEKGYQIGRSNPALIFDPVKQSRGAVHGDDFMVLGTKFALDDLGSLLKMKYKVRESYRLGFGQHCVRHATILNRVVTLGYEEGRKYVQIEPDLRHVDLILSSLGLGGSTKHSASPGMKITDEEIRRREVEAPLSKSEATRFRSCVMRAAFLAQDRADLSEAVKCLAQHMAKPTKVSMERLKRLGRYLCGRRSFALRYGQQQLSKTILVSVDSDHAADRGSRKSTTGMVQRLGTHPIKCSSNLQSAIGLNVSESEYYALTHGAAHGLGLQSYLSDWNLFLDLVVESDSTSAKAFASRRGLGKQRHVQTRYLWVQDRIAKGHFSIRKVASERNVSDILTKSSFTKQALDKHLTKLGFMEVEASPFHKQVTSPVEEISAEKLDSG